MKLDKNMRDKMRGLLPFDMSGVEEYTPKEYKELPEEFQPVYFLKPWNQGQKDKIALYTEQLNDEKSKDKSKINKQINELCRQQIVKIEKFYDIGKEEFVEVEIDSEKNCIKEDIWNIIPTKIQTSIYFCISSISGLVQSEVLGL